MQEFLEAIEKRRPLAHLWPLLAVGALGIAVAVAAWIAVSAWESRLAKVEFEDVAGDYATVLQNGMDHYVGELTAVRAFYDASVSVDASEFRLFTSRILDHPNHGSVMEIMWGPLVTGDERAAFVRKQRRGGLENFAITAWSLSGGREPAPRRATYLPVLYATGPYTTPSLIGMDLNSEPLRRSVIERAVKTDGMATGQNVVLRAVDGEERRGFFVALPVYVQHGIQGSAGHQELDGVLAATFDTAAMIDAILDRESLARSVSVYLFPADADGTTSAVYARPVADAASGTPTKAEIEAMPHWPGSLHVGDAHWDLLIVPHHAWPLSYYRAWLVVASIVLVFGAVLGYMWTSLRHALRLEKANTKILQLAQTDNLTMLANRRAFINRLSMAYAATLRGAAPFAVLYLDIDDFKDVNDTLGHAMGDELLKEVVVRLQDVVRAEDLVARFGGDEFAILATNITDPTEAGTLAERIGESLARPFVMDGHKFNVTSSIGIAVFSRDIPGPEAMMVQADLALYDAKDEGRNCYRFHSPDLDQQVHERVRISHELRAAIDDGELELYYQPQVELATGRVTGLEALVRWNHKTRGLLSPGAFIPIAERTGAVLQLGHWIFDEACRQYREWQAEGIAPDVLAVNVSGIQLKNATEFEQEVEASLVKWNVNPADMELELTETVLMEATQRHNTVLDNLRRLGLRIAIDDFGTGYSSLKYLTTYPVNRLKLAQEFVYRVTADYRNAAVVRAAIRLAHELGLDVIAEGVETEAQMRFLIGAGCEQAQGYYFSKPLPVAQITAILREGRIEPDASSQGQVTSAA